MNARSICLYGWYLLLPVQLHAASFDCARAKTAIEKAICSDSRLSDLDARMGLAYVKAQKIAGEGDVVVRRDQRIWLDGLNDLCDGKQLVACLVQQETSRLAVLEATRPLEASAVTVFKIQDASKLYDFTVRLFAKPADPGDDTREGPGHVIVSAKGQSLPLQSIPMSNIFLSLDKNGRPLVNDAALYDWQGVINVGDFNFDGQQDFAIQNGNAGAYGGPSYDVYLYSADTKNFVLNKPLSELIAGSLGFFQVDATKKLLITLSKDGCCYHVTTHYAVIDNKPVPRFREIEDASKSDKYVYVTDQEMVNGHWTKGTTKREAQK